MKNNEIRLLKYYQHTIMALNHKTLKSNTLYKDDNK